MINRWSKKLIKIHYTKQSRNKFTGFYSLVLLGLLVLFIISAVLLVFGVSLPKQADFQPTYDGWTIKNYACFSIGICLFIISFVLSIIIAFLVPTLYKSSRMMYFETNKYKKLVRKYDDADLTKYSKKELKWLYKLAYIQKVDYVSTLEKLKKTNNEHK